MTSRPTPPAVLLRSLVAGLGRWAATRTSSTRWPIGSRSRSGTRRAPSTPMASRCAPPPRGRCLASASRLNPRLTTGREPDGPMQPNAEPLPNYVATMPLPMSRKLLDARPQAVRHHLRDLPRPARRRQQHRRDADGAASAAVAATKYVAKPAGYIYEVITQGIRHDGVLRRRADGGRALGGRRVPSRAAAQPEHAGRRAAARNSAAAGGVAGKHGCACTRSAAAAKARQEEKR